MNPTAPTTTPGPRLFDAVVVDNVTLCREHLRLVLSGPSLNGALPGQFVHLGRPRTPHRNGREAASQPRDTAGAPLLRRAFSIAGLRAQSDASAELDVIYRIVGSATEWLGSLRAGDTVSVMGPLGNVFPISSSKTHAWVVGGGVGLPPLLWLSEFLQRAERRGVAMIGARSRDLLALRINGAACETGTEPRLIAEEFGAYEVPVLLSTDDGSLGVRGHAAGLLETYFDHAAVPASGLVVYTCGPERMMQAVAAFCGERSIECYACVERAMACGAGTCQSCVVAVSEPTAVDGWRYELCCTQGPVFDAGRVLWSGSVAGGVQH